MNTPLTNNEIKKIIRKGVNKFKHLKKNHFIKDILKKHINDNDAESYKHFRRKEQFIINVVEDTILNHVTDKNINIFNEDEQLELISLDDYFFIHIKNKTYKLSLEAVKRFGMNIKYVPDNFKTLELCREALKYSHEAIQFIKPHNLPKDDYINIITQTVSRQGTVIRFVPPEYQTNYLKELAVINEPGALRYINNLTTEFCINTIKKFSYAYLYIPKHMYNSNELIRALIDEGWLFIVEYINECNKQIDKLKDR